MSHLCRELFFRILNQPGKLLKILQSQFNLDNILCEDIITNDFKY